MNDKQRGITVIETVGALAIGSLLLLGLTQMMNDSVEDLKGQQAALYQSQLAEGLRKYMRSNAQAIQASLGGTAVLTLTIADLKNGGSPAGSLPANFGATNAYGQSPCILIRRSASGVPYQFDALVVTHGGMPIPEKDIAVVAMNAGQGGGYVSMAQPELAQGAGWSVDTSPYRGVACGGGADALTGTVADGGHLATAVYHNGPGRLGSDYLHRNDVPGHPELTTMNAPIRMADVAQRSVGTPCGTEAAIAVDAVTRYLLTCGANQTWQGGSSWREPVFDFEDLPTAGNFEGDVRMVVNLNRAFTFSAWSNWEPLAADENGDFAANEIFASANVVTMGTLLGNHVSAQTIDATDIQATNRITANIVQGTKRVEAGYLRANRFTETGEMIVTRRMNPGDDCHIPTIDDGVAVHSMPIGTVLLDANGLPLVCANDKKFRYTNGTFSPN